MKKIITVILITIMMLCSVFSAGAVRNLGMINVDPWPFGNTVMYPLFPFEDNTYTEEYKQNFETLMKQESKNIELFGDMYEHMGLDPTEPNYYYDELYYHYSSTNDQATPDFVVVECMLDFYDLNHTFEFFGDYVIADYYKTYPDSLGYYVFIPSTAEILTLRQAWDTKVEGINAVFEKGIIGQRLGDVDKDSILTVKDATAIQKAIAEIAIISQDKFSIITEHIGTSLNPIPMTEHKYISDIDLDGQRTIKDATAIQKHIAGLPY